MMRKKESFVSKENLPLEDHEELYVIKLDDGYRLDLDRMLMVDPKLQLERKRHQVLLKIRIIFNKKTKKKIEIWHTWNLYELLSCGCKRILCWMFRFLNFGIGFSKFKSKCCRKIRIESNSLLKIINMKLCQFRLIFLRLILV